MSEQDFSARPTPTLGVWSVWVHGGRHNPDGSNVAFIQWPDTWELKIPKRFVLMTERAYADLTKTLIDTDEHKASSQ